MYVSLHMARYIIKLSYFIYNLIPSGQVGRLQKPRIQSHEITI